MLSVVSIWEVVIKRDLSKLHLHRPLDLIVRDQQANGVQVLPVHLEHALAVSDLPAIHSDPFDRLLIAQATVEGAALISADSHMAQYAVQIVW